MDERRRNDDNDNGAESDRISAQNLEAASHCGCHPSAMRTLCVRCRPWRPSGLLEPHRRTVLREQIRQLSAQRHGTFRSNDSTIDHRRALHQLSSIELHSQTRIASPSGRDWAFGIAVMRVSLPVIPKDRYSHTHSNYSIPESDVQYSMYNPSIIHVQPALRESLPDEARSSAAYFCLFRVSGLGCLNTVPGHELLGVAILDRNFQVLDGFNVVIDINKVLNMREGGSHFMDYRVFDVDGQLYLSSQRFLLPFDVSTSRNASVHTPFPNVYGDGLFMSHPPYVRAKHLRVKGSPSPGKNIQIFKTHNGSTMM